MCKFYEYSVLEVEVAVAVKRSDKLSHCVTAIHRYEFGFHFRFAYSTMDCDLS